VYLNDIAGRQINYYPQTVSTYRDPEDTPK
jgi:hypothetical protein